MFLVLYITVLFCQKHSWTDVMLTSIIWNRFDVTSLCNLHCRNIYKLCFL